MSGKVTSGTLTEQLQKQTVGFVIRPSVRPNKDN
jgi:hypothetical protein